jgi:predicted RNase H-like HicB family nuclease
MTKYTVRYSEEEECFVAECPSWDIAVGTGETLEDAVNMLHEMLEECKKDLENGKIHPLSMPKKEFYD